MNCTTTKHSNYPDLILPLAGCIYGKPVENCPFAIFWEIASFEERIHNLYQLDMAQLERLRQFHRHCVHQIETIKQDKFKTLSIKK